MKTKIFAFIVLSTLFTSCFVFEINDYKTIDATIYIKNQKDTIAVGDTIWFESILEPTANLNNKEIDLTELSIPFVIMIKQFKGNNALDSFESTIPTTSTFDFVPMFLKNDAFFGTNSIYTAGIGGYFITKNDKLYAEIAFVAKDTGSFVFSAFSYDVLYKKFVNKKNYLKPNYSFLIENSHKLNSLVIEDKSKLNLYYAVVVK